MATNPLATKTITIVFIAALFILGLFILRPIIISVFLGLLLAYIFHPVYQKLNRKIKRRRLSALILIGGLVLIVTLPLVYLAPLLVRQTFEAYLFLQNVDLVTPVQELFPSLFQDSRTLAVNLNSYVSQLFNSLLNGLGAFLVSLPGFMLQFIVFIFTFYFSISDSEKLKSYFMSLSPFPPSIEAKFLQEFRKITNSLIYGQFLIGILQGFALGLALLFLGVPNFLILTFLASIMAIIPILGAWIIWIPVAIYFLTIGSPIKALILAVYGTFFVGSLDNFLRPYLLSKNSRLPVSIGLIGIIAGLYAFGIVGIILGPLIFAYILIILDFYREGKLSELFKE